jgi:hypothetical protein
MPLYLGLATRYFISTIKAFKGSRHESHFAHNIALFELLRHLQTHFDANYIIISPVVPMSNRNSNNKPTRKSMAPQTQVSTTIEALCSFGLQASELLNIFAKFLDAPSLGLLSAASLTMRKLFLDNCRKVLCFSAEIPTSRSLESCNQIHYNNDDQPCLLPDARALLWEIGLIFHAALFGPIDKFLFESLLPLGHSVTIKHFLVIENPMVTPCSDQACFARKSWLNDLRSFLGTRLPLPKNMLIIKLIDVDIDKEFIELLRKFASPQLYIETRQLEASFIFKNFRSLKKLELHFDNLFDSYIESPKGLEELILYFQMSNNSGSKQNANIDTSCCKSLKHL